jgi:NAD(P)-dependent dehydrogenase (short-subunit alcohol dehydrogenase family)
MKEQAIQDTVPAHQPRIPAIETVMVPPLQLHPDAHASFRKLEGKVALVTAGDSAIGRAVAIAFAREGADVAFIHLDQHGEAKKTASAVEAAGGKCLKISADVGDESLCRDAVDEVISSFGKLDILVNNGAEQHSHAKLEDLTEAQLLRTFQCNVFSMFYLTKAALPSLRKGARVINTTSVAAYRGNSDLLDYAATKGAIVAFTRSLSLALANRGILVNAVAPGLYFAPLVPLDFYRDKIAHFGANTPLQRPGQAEEIAHCYVFLACEDSSYMTGQVLHPNGGEIING